MSYKRINLKSKDLNRDEKQVTFQIYKENSTMSLEEIRKLKQEIQRQGTIKYGNYKIALIRVLNGDKYASFKSIDDFNNYYEGKVQEVDKFQKFYQMQFTVIH